MHLISLFGINETKGILVLQHSIVKSIQIALVHKAMGVHVRGFQNTFLNLTLGHCKIMSTW